MYQLRTAFLLAVIVLSFMTTNAAEVFETFVPASSIAMVSTPTNGGIRENFAARFRNRFERWKAELRTTTFGREQWDRYATNKQFILTIVITNSKGKGGGTSNLLWDDSGRFVGATISLGGDLDDGYPAPIYYPVLNSLSADTDPYRISGDILAATKIAHEIGHLNQTLTANQELLELQNSLIPVYNSILLKNGRRTDDEKLVDLQRQMGGTPVEIWESREYWSEVNAMLFLKERLSKEEFFCTVFNKIKNNLENYARDYERRFDDRPEFSNSPCWKS